MKETIRIITKKLLRKFITILLVPVASVVVFLEDKQAYKKNVNTKIKSLLPKKKGECK